MRNQEAERFFDALLKAAAAKRNNPLDRLEGQIDVLGRTMDALDAKLDLLMENDRRSGFPERDGVNEPEHLLWVPVKVIGYVSMDEAYNIAADAIAEVGEGTEDARVVTQGLFASPESYKP